MDYGYLNAVSTTNLGHMFYALTGKNADGIPKPHLIYQIGKTITAIRKHRVDKFKAYMIERVDAVMTITQAKAQAKAKAPPPNYVQTREEG